MPVREPVFRAWSEPSFHYPAPLSPPLDRFFILTKCQQVLLDKNIKGIFYLPGFCTAVSCGLSIEIPVPSGDHMDKDPRKTPLYIWGRRQDINDGSYDFQQWQKRRLSYRREQYERQMHVISTPTATTPRENTSQASRTITGTTPTLRASALVAA